MPSHDAGPFLRYIEQNLSATYRNTYIEGVCAVCRGPARDELCYRCASHRNLFGDQLLDQAVLLTYAQAYREDFRQPVHDLYAYKGEPPATESLLHLAVMLGAAAAMHIVCIRRVLGGGTGWGGLTFVPSLRRPGATHPLSQVTDFMVATAGLGSVPRVKLTPNNMGNGRTLTADRFVVDPESVATVRGADVLVVEDTWVTGTNVQAASLALKLAGAQSVTAVCLARYLRKDWGDHAQLCHTLDPYPYDPRRCPAGMCTHPI